MESPKKISQLEHKNKLINLLNGMHRCHRTIVRRHQRPKKKIENFCSLCVFRCWRLWFFSVCVCLWQREEEKNGYKLVLIRNVWWIMTHIAYRICWVFQLASNELIDQTQIIVFTQQSQCTKVRLFIFRLRRCEMFSGDASSHIPFKNLCATHTNANTRQCAAKCEKTELAATTPTRTISSCHWCIVHITEIAGRLFHFNQFGTRVFIRSAHNCILIWNMLQFIFIHVIATLSCGEWD